MRTLALILALATPALATSPCHQSFCRQHVAVVKAVGVHRAHHVYPSAYYVPYGAQSYGSFADQADILTAAIKTGVGEVLDERGIGALRAQASASIVLTKCGKCHGEGATNAEAHEAWSFAGVPLSWKDAARAQDGIVNHGMATKAKLTDEEQSQLVSELTGYLTSAASEK